MGDRRCCCAVAGCLEYSDTFTRADNADPGTDWNEIVGDWGILNNMLVEDYDPGTGGTAGATIIYTQPVSVYSAGQMNITVEVLHADLEDGDEYRLYPCCTDENTLGPVYVKFTWNATTEEWTTTISSGGVGSVYTAPWDDVSGTHRLYACADDLIGMVRGWVGGTVNEWAAWSEADPGNGRYAGLYHNNTGHLNRFDNWTLKDIRSATELCEPCFCSCDNYTPYPTVHAEIIMTTERAACLEGLNWDMVYNQGPQEEEWDGGTTVERAAGDEALNFKLVCGSGNEAFVLKWMYPLHCQHQDYQRLDADDDDPPSSGSSIQQWTADPVLSSCDPFRLVFGPFDLSFERECYLCYSQLDPGTCVMPSPPFDHTNCRGDFYIEITEV